MDKFNFRYYGLNTRNQIKYLKGMGEYFHSLAFYWAPVEDDDFEEHLMCSSNTLARKANYFARRAEEVARSWQSRQRNDDMDEYRRYKRSSNL